jgi:hydroxymethylpyrimidine/phosphomethylpyrimidine kinase
MKSEEKKKSIEALRAAALKAIKFGYLDLASQVMFVAETLERSNEEILVDLPPTVLTFKKDAANW